ncbi:MAG: hypothetical protein WCD28_04890, partial [Nitrososphaeraceae archaeon]
VRDPDGSLGSFDCQGSKPIWWNSNPKEELLSYRESEDEACRKTRVKKKGRQLSVHMSAFYALSLCWFGLFLLKF